MTLTGGIDLFVEQVVKLSILVSAILATLALGTLIGFVHGLIIVRLNVAPFIVTLGTYSILRGISLAIATAPVGRASAQDRGFH